MNFILSAREGKQSLAFLKQFDDLFTETKNGIKSVQFNALKNVCIRN